MEICERRDAKGLYKKALDGGIRDFTGISSAYEEPAYPDIVADTDKNRAAYWIRHIFGYALDLQNDYCKMTKKLIYISLFAGRKIMRIYKGEFDVAYKDDKSPLTIADRQSNKYIVDKLRQYYPAYAVLSEEEKDNADRLKNRYCFIVDPLDGTKEFIKKNGEFTVNIALSYRGKSILGVVYAPAMKKLFYCAPGYGSYRMDIGCEGTVSVKDDIFDEAFRINVSGNTEKLTVMTSRSHSGEDLHRLLEKNKEKIGSAVQSGSSLKGCLIAAGEADVYYRTGPTMEWDTAAMQAIVEGAGGVFRQGDGTAMRYNRKDTRNVKGFYILNKIENRFEEA